MEFGVQGSGRGLKWRVQDLLWLGAWDFVRRNGLNGISGGVGMLRRLGSSIPGLVLQSFLEKALNTGAPRAPVKM